MKLEKKKGKKKKKREREKRETCSWAKELIQTQNTKQNPILKIKLNQNKQIWKKEKKERTSQFDPVSHIIQT